MKVGEDEAQTFKGKSQMSGNKDAKASYQESRGEGVTFPSANFLLQALRLLLCSNHAPLQGIPGLLQASDMRLHGLQRCSGCRRVCLLPV